jgi:hypothetical protein
LFDLAVTGRIGQNLVFDVLPIMIDGGDCLSFGHKYAVHNNVITACASHPRRGLGIDDFDLIDSE